MIASLARLLEPLSALVLVTALFAAAARRTESRLRIYTAQSAAVSLWILLYALDQGHAHLYALAVVGFIAKCVWFPRLLASDEAMRTRIDPRDGPGGALSLAAAGALAAGARWFSTTIPVEALPGRDAVAAGFASALAGLFLIAARRRPRAQATGLLVLENGVALAVIAAAGSWIVVGLMLAFECLLAGALVALRAPGVADAIEESEQTGAAEASE